MPIKYSGCCKDGGSLLVWLGPEEGASTPGWFLRLWNGTFPFRVRFCPWCGQEPRHPVVEDMDFQHSE